MFGLAGIQAGLLLLQLSQLKNNPSSILRQLLPPLEVIEKFLVDLLWFGCIILGSGLVFGLQYLPSDKILPYMLLPKTLFSLMGFSMIISGVIIRQFFVGLKTSLLAKLTLISMSILIFSYFGTR